jgi:hypothetical protein
MLPEASQRGRRLGPETGFFRDADPFAGRPLGRDGPGLATSYVRLLREGHHGGLLLARLATLPGRLMPLPKTVTSRNHRAPVERLR